MRTLVLATSLLALGCSKAATEAPASAEAPADDATVSPGPAAAEGLPDRDPALAKRLVDEEGAVLLDVRTPQEHAEGHIEGSVNISHEKIVADDAEALAELEALTGGDKGKAIVVYCRSGGRAGKAKAALEAAGYTRVTNVGGMDDYP
ncbi:MAG: rhodanese-like domain-containing protein [Nannocystaceae bacterium]|nr:rhodanese-like domain-containing protein [bacterium]